MSVELRSDNAAGVAPEILAAIAAANRGSALGYGGDDWTAQLTATVREVFEHPTATVYPVATGTAANALGLTSMCQPWQAVVCHESSHIYVNECSAVSMLGGGLTMRAIPGPAYKLSPESLSIALAAVRWGDNHQSQPAVLSLTQPTDFGTLYSVNDVASLAAIARDLGMAVHIDGARIANALAALRCSPAELTWKAGVSMISLGGIKNGLMSADAIVCFDRSFDEQLDYRTKRSGHVSSKMRFQSVQLTEYLTNDLWLRLAQHSNAEMCTLASGLADVGLDLLSPPAVNMAFVRLEADRADRLQTAGVQFYRTAPGVIRLVTSFQTTDADIEHVVSSVARGVTHFPRA